MAEVRKQAKELRRSKMAANNNNTDDFDMVMIDTDLFADVKDEVRMPDSISHRDKLGFHLPPDIVKQASKGGYNYYMKLVQEQEQYWRDFLRGKKLKVVRTLVGRSLATVGTVRLGMV